MPLLLPELNVKQLFFIWKQLPNIDNKRIVICPTKTLISLTPIRCPRASLLKLLWICKGISAYFDSEKVEGTCCAKRTWRTDLRRLWVCPRRKRKTERAWIDSFNEDRSSLQQSFCSAQQIQSAFENNLWSGSIISVLDRSRRTRDGPHLE